MNNVDFVSPIPGYRLVETFEYYDFPILFSCIDLTERLYLAMCAEELESGYRWLLCPMSENRLNVVRAGKLSLRNAFVRSETGYAYEYLDTFDINNRRWQIVMADSIPEEDLPGAEAALDLGQTGLPTKDQGPTVVSVQTRRDVLDIALLARETHTQEIEAEILGTFLVRFQLFAYALAYKDGGKRGKIPREIRTNNAFSVAGNFHAASFGIRLESNALADIFNKTSTREVISTVFSLMTAGDDRDTLDQIVANISARAVMRYGFLLSTLKDARMSLVAEWGSPDGHHLKVSLNSNQISNIINILGEAGDESVETIHVEGELVAIDVKRNSFKLNSFDGELYTGILSEDLEGYVFEVPKHVEATIIEILMINSVTKEERSVYELAAVKLLN